MRKLSLKFQHCYGIKNLEHLFKFSNRTFAIYAPNGVMKTSFAKTFQDYASDKETKDLAFPERVTVREITDETGNNIPKDNVFVIEPYNEDYASDKITTLLANKTLKQQYDEIHKSINSAKDNFIKKLKQLSGLSGRTITIEEEIENIFSESFYEVLLSLESEVDGGSPDFLHSIYYKEIFNDKVLAFLKTKNFKTDIEEYISRYNELIDQSVYLKKDFNFHHIETVNKQLNSNNFFSAGHSVNLFDGQTKKEFISEEELNSLVTNEKIKVLSDPDLQKRFNTIDSKLTNTELRQFRDFLLDNKDVLPYLVDLDSLAKQFWISYFTYEKDLFKALLDEYKKGQDKIKGIIDLAKSEYTDWEKAVGVFNTRFVHLPYYLSIENKEDVILENEIPTLSFTFKDGVEERVYKNNKSEKAELLKILSTGEKRALYILNIIFEVEARRKEFQETLFIIDDIADSFDYKNKYAIIDYLKYISEIDIFFMIILTHNFDFYRTIESRKITFYNQCLMAVRNASNIQLLNAEYIKNPFIKNWKDNLADNKKLVASIPFIRNIIEYTKDDENDDYLKLTSLLHHKSNTEEIRLKDLKEVFLRAIPSIPFPDLNIEKKVIDLIYETAEECLIASEGINLENKIVLSIAIRLKAEEFMKTEIPEEDSIDGLEENKNQTWQLINKYSEIFNNELEAIDILKRAQLLTPDNIHINSFMYEPILDMGDIELRGLFKDLKNIRNTLIRNNDSE